MKLKEILNDPNDVSATFAVGLIGIFGAMAYTIYAADLSTKHSRNMLEAFNSAVQKNPELAEVRLQRDGVTMVGSVLKGETVDDGRLNPDAPCWIANAVIVDGKKNETLFEKLTQSDQRTMTAWADGRWHQGCVLPPRP